MDFPASSDTAWVDGFPGMISVCDAQGRIIAMNQAIAQAFEGQGGKALVGTSLFDCHNSASNAEICQLLESGRSHVYIALEEGRRELVLHCPWFQDGTIAGLVEIALELGGGEIEIRRR